MLLLPVLVPSWRFFDRIGPSPRVEIRRDDGEWRAFRPRPARLHWVRMIARVFWNPDWNDALFVTSCAERILLDERAHAIREIKDRATVDYARQFRLLLVSREGEQAKQEIVWISPQWNRQA